jgi:hypothetical protein
LLSLAGRPEQLSLVLLPTLTWGPSSVNFSDRKLAIDPEVGCKRVTKTRTRVPQRPDSTASAGFSLLGITSPESPRSSVAPNALTGGFVREPQPLSNPKRSAQHHMAAENELSIALAAAHASHWRTELLDLLNG